MQNKLGFGGGPTYVILWLIGWLLYLFELFHSVTYMRLCCVCLLTFVFLGVNRIIIQVHSLPLLLIQLFCFEWYSFGIHAQLINYHACFISLVETHYFRGVEGCYSLYRTFPISNLTPEPIFGFNRPHFSK